MVVAEAISGNSDLFTGIETSGIGCSEGGQFFSGKVEHVEASSRINCQVIIADMIDELHAVCSAFDRGAIVISFRL